MPHLKGLVCDALGLFYCSGEMHGVLPCILMSIML